MSESLESFSDMGLPAAVLHALVPRSPSLAEVQKPPKPSSYDVDRFTSGHAEPSAPEPVVAELRRVAELHQAHQAQQAARAAGDTA